MLIGQPTGRRIKPPNECDSPSSMNSELNAQLAQAIQLDRAKRYGEAAQAYNRAVVVIEKSVFIDAKLHQKATECRERAKIMREYELEEADVNRAKQLLKLAMDKERENKVPREQLIQLYRNAGRTCLEFSKKHTRKRDYLKKFAIEAIERAEALQVEGQLEQFHLPDIPGDIPVKPIVKPTTPVFSLATPTPTPPPPPQQPTTSGSKLTKEEISILASDSTINGIQFVPFEPRDASKAALFLPGGRRWVDPEGKLALSAKQEKRLEAWHHAEDKISSSVIINQVSPRNVTQTCVSDCSFVSALILSAGYERKFKRQLLTCSIFPQENKQPVVNPSGRYCIRLYLNGCWRRILIDTKLPFSKSGKILGSFSADKQELWVSLIEKAYMKVMGGYDFPGSNSSIDLNALTGWIPERKSLKEENAVNIHHVLQERMRNGHVLATMATGELSDEMENKSGLVPTHAYALLDLRSVGTLKFVKLKNPWAEQSWKGRYSSKDVKSWTPELRKALSYNPEMAEKDDDGIFWIEWSNLVQFFDVCYMSWDPRMFSNSQKYHGKWAQGPKKDLYSVGSNPQYRLDVNAKGDTTLWIVLSRHITQKADFANNKDFITLMVYKLVVYRRIVFDKTFRKNGERVYLPRDGLHLDGIRINSPFYLTKLKVPKGVEKFTLVVSEYEKTHDISFTLEVFANVPISLKPIDKLTNQRRVKGEWSLATAGGCQNNRDTFTNNPIHLIEVTNNETLVVVELRAPKEYSVGIQIIEGATEKTVHDSGNYRPGYTMVQGNLDPGKYMIRVSTFKSSQIGPYMLDFSFNKHISFL